MVTWASDGSYRTEKAFLKQRGGVNILQRDNNDDALRSTDAQQPQYVHR